MNVDEQKQQLGRSIEAHRKAMGLSQAQLAQALGIGVGQSHVSAIERGKNTPSIALFVRLAQVLQTDPNTLIGWGGAATEAPVNATRFVVSEADGEAVLA